MPLFPGVGALWAMLAIAYALVFSASGIAAHFSALDILFSGIFWGIAGLIAGAVCDFLARRLKITVSGRILGGAVILWGAAELLFLAMFVAKPTRWPLPSFLVALGVCLVPVAVVGLHALWRNPQKQPAAAAAQRLAAAVGATALLAHWLPVWWRAVLQSSFISWLPWGFLDLAYFAVVLTPLWLAPAIVYRKDRWRRHRAGGYVACLLLVGLSTVRSESGTNSSVKGESIIWLMIDATRADHTSLYGYPRKTTPNLDELAAHGSVFMQTVASGSKTDDTVGHLYRQSATSSKLAPPAPGPLSGLRNIWNPASPGGDDLLGTLQARGYRTAIFSTYVDLLNDKGLRPWFGTFSRVEPLRQTGDASSGTTILRKLGGHRLDGVPAVDWFNAARRELYTRTLVERAVAWAKRQSGPYFLFVHLPSGHYPYLVFQGPSPLLGLTVEERHKRIEAAQARLYETTRADLTQISSEDLQFQIDAYDEAIIDSDRLAAPLYQFVEQQADTRLFVFSDHGHRFPNEGDYFKGQAPAHMSLVPMVVVPALGSAQRQHVLNSTLDISATTRHLVAGSMDCEPGPSVDLRCATPFTDRALTQTGKGAKRVFRSAAGKLRVLDLVKPFEPQQCSELAGFSSELPGALQVAAVESALKALRHRCSGEAPAP